MSVQLSESHVSHSSSIILSSSSSSLLKGRSVFPVPMSSTCKLDRCAKELSSTESTDRRLNLEMKWKWGKSGEARRLTWYSDAKMQNDPNVQRWCFQRQQETFTNSLCRVVRMTAGISAVQDPSVGHAERHPKPPQVFAHFESKHFWKHLQSTAKNSSSSENALICCL